MKELSLDQMENIEGGCDFATGAVLGAWAVGIGAAFAPVSFGASVVAGLVASTVVAGVCSSDL